MWRIMLAAAGMFFINCGDKSTSPDDETLNLQSHTESDVSWDYDKMAARNITWGFLSFEKEANGHPASIGKFGFTLVNGDTIDKHVAYDLHFLDSTNAQIAVALYPYTSIDSLPTVKADSTLSVNGYFQTSSIRSTNAANTITTMKVFASFFAL